MVRDSIIIFCITFGILIIAEISLRLIYPEKITNEIDPASLAYEYNSNSIISLKPNITKEFKHADVNGGHLVTWETNSLGYRGEEISKNKGYRIIAYGDSNIQARFSELENTYPEKLEQFLTERISNLEVINGGLVGAGPDQSLLRFIEDADVIKPDMLVLHIFADNDYGDIIRNRLFELDENGNLLRTSFAIKKDQQISSEDSNITNYLYSLLLTRALVSLFSQDESKLSRDERNQITLNNLQRKSDLEYLNFINGGEKSVSHFADHYDIDIATDPSSEAAQIKIKLMQKVLERLKMETDKRKVQLVVVVQPAAYDIIKENSIIDRSDLSRYKQYNYKNLTNPLKDICKSVQLYCIHLVDEFIAREPTALYLKEDNHWNDSGQNISARITAEYIIRNNLHE